eukprot:CAMPEP_0170560376 /NCGR_PEP_ID=MMETSP0211-20121228/48542_1 /TAXON_ID=311385 /ORGANISM="Pseudokeronopsis sp., Strain OXSARD2" /LENGTH=56 /DNA_ID=CAMNT_0010874481 /DNA_START=379 /DNA_END=549 /DNA_ORIENTATION=-
MKDLEETYSKGTISSSLKKKVEVLEEGSNGFETERVKNKFPLVLSRKKDIVKNLMF